VVFPAGHPFLENLERANNYVMLVRQGQEDVKFGWRQ
jgi:hypothetical protein